MTETGGGWGGEETLRKSGKDINKTLRGRERIRESKSKERESTTSAKPMQTWAHIPKPLLSLHLFFPLLRKTA